MNNANPKLNRFTPLPLYPFSPGFDPCSYLKIGNIWLGQ
jgi:hypothetical protein